MGSELKKKLDEEAAAAAESEAEVETDIVGTEAEPEPELDAEGNVIVPEADEPVEPWMETGDQQPVSVKAHVKLKKKFQKATEEKDTELEKLKAEVEALKSGPANQVATSTLKRPDELDFDTTAEFQQALDSYDDARAIERENVRRNDRTRKETARRTADAVNSHFDRADTFIEESKIKPEVYEAADNALRKTFDKAFPGGGDALTDRIIEALGEGSEKTGFFVGRNKLEQEKIEKLLNEDPYGLKVMAYLGGLNEKFKNHKTKKLKTNARPPAAEVTGGESLKGEASLKILKQKYDSHHKKDEGDKAWKIKRQAKKAGFDVSGWAST